MPGYRRPSLLWGLQAGRGAGNEALIAVIVFEVYALLIASLYLAVGGQEGPATLGLRPASITAVALAVAVGTVSWVAVTVGYAGLGSLHALLKALLWIGSDGGRLETLGALPSTFSVVRACVLAPIGEELLFRGALFSWFRSRFSAWPAILATSALFAVMHFMPLAIMPIAFVLGLGLAWVRERTDSTLPGMVFHVAQNVVIVAGVHVLSGRLG